ncbi:hypothetical protein [Caenimonas sp. SL110]|uniref:hypothetical protein n=1 Tax=Caenimonas sp. SL110 TaxID=1450524 RepID=UPI00065458A1|nr:hypothetical protein [Caenimonas sp. SL110]
MKIREKISNLTFDVYGIYWHADKAYFYCFPRKSTGLSSYSEEEVEVFDARIDDDFVFVTMAQGASGILHRHLVADALLDQLLEHDPEAYAKFKSLIGREP